MATGGSVDSPDRGSSKDENIRAEYTQAQELAMHTDVIIHEVAAIVWGANTLLFGFILEVPCTPNNQRLVIIGSVLGIFLSVYVPWVQWLTKKGQNIAYSVCREIEGELALSHRLHTRIYQIYPKKRGQAAIWLLTLLFVGGWGWVIHHAWACLHNF
jgi:hypothetical protein